MSEEKPISGGKEGSELPESPAQAAGVPQDAAPAQPQAEAESEPAQEGPEPEPKGRALFIVGIGASAGGLEALAELIKYLPTERMAFIVVQHLAPDHESLLTQILARGGRFEVVTAADGMPIEARHVYVIPPNADLAVMHGVIRVIVPPSPHAPRLPIDFLFRSLADDQGASAIGIVLSGTGTDGTFGLKAIKAAGGLAFVQEPSTAKYDGMPRSAMASGATDFCLAPMQIGEELARIAQGFRVERPPRSATPSARVQDQLGKLFVLLRSEFGNDLTHYKHATIDRRIERRMTLHRIEHLEDYVRFVQQNRGELQALYKDLLITVTSFFRDPDAFDTLKRTVFPQLLEHKEPGRPLRIWVPACSTGEEAYSIAMSLLEYCDEHARGTRIQMFGTDVDDDLIQQARRGAYPANIELDVSADRLNRFFVKKDNEYVVSRTIRDLLVFSKQNLLKDAPFSRIDLVSCRNLLIYLQPLSQKKVLRILHYALNPSGYLLLGTSETVGDAPDLFATVDRKNKIYLKKAIVSQAGLDLGLGVDAPPQAPPQLPARPTLSLQGQADRKVLEWYGPPGVLINESLDILQFRGHTGPYLDPAPGAVSWNLMRLARIELHIELKRAIREAQSQQQRVTTEVAYLDGGTQSIVKLDVAPLVDPDTKVRCLLVLFHRMPPPKEIPVPMPQEGMTVEAALPLAQRNQDLERELTVTKEYLQATVEEKESTLEELKSANEELQSSNEELQSTNEELETSKEEMQSTNEELTTVNEELHNRMTELSQTNDDLHNVLAGVDNAVVIVGMDLKIRRFTSAAEKLFNLVPGDIGRSIGFLDTFIGQGALEPKVASVIQNLAALEEEIRASNQRWYTIKINPYKTLDHAIRGALVTLIDIDIRKRAQEMMRDVGAYAARFLAPIGHPLLIVDRKLRVVWSNDPLVSMFQLTAEETVGSLLPNLAARQFADPKLLERLDDVFSTGSILRDYAFRLVVPGGGERWVRVGASQVPAISETPLVLLSIEPSTAAERVTS